MLTSGTSEEKEFNREVTISASRYQRLLASELRESAEIERWYSRKIGGFTALYTAKAVQGLKTGPIAIKFESPILGKLVSRQFRQFLQTLACHCVKAYGEPKRLTDTNQLAYQVVTESTDEKYEPPLSRSEISRVRNRNGAQVFGGHEVSDSWSALPSL